MGGRLSHQRSTRPLVPANFLDRNAPFPPPPPRRSRNTGRLAAGVSVSPARWKSIFAQSLSPDGWEPGDFAQIAAPRMNLTPG